MFQAGLDDLPVFDEADDPHGSPTLRTGQRIDLVDLLDQPGPVLPAFLRTFISFQDAGNPTPRHPKSGRILPGTWRGN